MKVLHHNALDYLGIRDEKHWPVASENSKKFAILFNVLQVQLWNGLSKAEKIADERVGFRAGNAALVPVVKVAR